MLPVIASAGTWMLMNFDTPNRSVLQWYQPIVLVITEPQAQATTLLSTACERQVEHLRVKDKSWSTSIYQTLLDLVHAMTARLCLLAFSTYC